MKQPRQLWSVLDDLPENETASAARLAALMFDEFERVVYAESALVDAGRLPPDSMLRRLIRRELFRRQIAIVGEGSVN